MARIWDMPIIIPSGNMGTGSSNLTLAYWTAPVTGTYTIGVSIRLLELFLTADASATNQQLALALAYITTLGTINNGVDITTAASLVNQNKAATFSAAFTGKYNGGTAFSAEPTTYAAGRVAMKGAPSVGGYVYRPPLFDPEKAISAKPGSTGQSFGLILLAGSYTAIGLRGTATIEEYLE